MTIWMENEVQENEAKNEKLDQTSLTWVLAIIIALGCDYEGDDKMSPAMV